MKVKISRVDKSLPLPEYKTSGAVAFDVYARIETNIPAGGSALIPSNLIIQVPKGHALLLIARSSTHKKGLRFNNAVGVVDQDYHGPNDEIMIALYNFLSQDILVAKGDRIGQGLIVPIAQAEWEEIDKIKEDSRGGFGTTG